MKYYHLDFFGITRKLPIVSLGPKIKIASLNLLGDTQLVNVASREIVNRIKDLDFDYLVGPEVKVLPIMHQVANILKHDRYIICRKGIKGYMVNPISSDTKPSLVLNGVDAEMIKDKKVLIIDDVVSTGKTIKTLENLLSKVNSNIVASIAIFKQGAKPTKDIDNFIFLKNLPIFETKKL